MRKTIIFTALIGVLVSVTAWAEPKRLNGDDLVPFTQGGPYLVYTIGGDYSHITFYENGTHMVRSPTLNVCFHRKRSFRQLENRENDRQLSANSGH